MPNSAPASPTRKPIFDDLRICVAVAAGTPDELLKQSRSLLPVYPFQELRLDALSSPEEGVGVLRRLRQEYPEAIFLATCRPERSGGAWPGSAQGEVAMLRAAAEAGAAWVDLSLESAEELGPGAPARLREGGASVLLSFHDFVKTGDLEGVLARMRPFEPDLFKIVPTAHSLRDSLAVLRLLRSHASDTVPIVAISMGEPGLITRVLGPAAGSAFTFGATTEAQATAPGQIPAGVLRDLYRIPHIGPATRIFGVAGSPIRSSMSPLMQNSAFRYAGLDAVYLPLLTAEPEELMEVARVLPLDGFSVTMPLKQTLIPLLDDIDPLAARIGAVNTVRRTPQGKFHGYNTDAAGITVPLERRIDLANARVLVLGAGGAARAAVFACADRGARVSICNRTAATAEALATEAGAVVLPPSELKSESFDVLINATPAGMYGNPRALPIEDGELNARLVFDLVYNPVETALLKLARSRGLEVIAGTEMFVEQGARQFELWIGSPAPVAVMEQGVLQVLRERGL